MAQEVEVFWDLTTALFSAEFLQSKQPKCMNKKGHKCTAYGLLVRNPNIFQYNSFLSTTGQQRRRPAVNWQMKFLVKTFLLYPVRKKAQPKLSNGVYRLMLKAKYQVCPDTIGRCSDNTEHQPNWG